MKKLNEGTKIAIVALATLICVFILGYRLGSRSIKDDAIYHGHAIIHPETDLFTWTPHLRISRD